MMSVMHKIEDYVLDSPIASTYAYDKLVEKFWAALLSWQHFHPGRGTGVHKLTSIFHFGMPPTAKKEIQRIF